MPLQGKGMYIWKIARCEGGNPAAIAQRAVGAGLSHVLVKIADGVSSYNDPLAEPLIQALKADGIQAWGWHYIYGEQPREEAAIAVRSATALGVDGFVANAEVQYKTRHAAAGQFIEALSAGLPGIPIVLSSFRYPDYHADFPWTEFLSRCALNMPQVYWVKATDPAAQLDRSLAQFQRIYPVLPIIPTGAAYEEGGWRPKPAEITQFLTHAREIGLAAANFWSWDYAGSPQGADLWQAIASYSWPAAGLSAQPSAPERLPAASVPQMLFSALGRGDIPAALGLYQPDALIVTAQRIYQGLDSVRAYLADLLTNILPGASFSLSAQTQPDDSTFQVQWSALSPTGHSASNGYDTFQLRDGLIQYHSSTYRVE